ncbi:ABC transporter permease [Alkalicoccus halolimnae]|uniref:ABC transporter permease n=1 Tax=Alkalicoccus halolimnae TaxID=1667239 RepID=A0A5C7FDW8_9BACI|nr:ABC transporter permease [Alkalicoccus halolimnae]TXF83564.1 ABC transporter permease [Alkalicoccus halolimnae]
MFWMMIKKDIIQLKRDRNELLVLLLMPIVLITILGLALQGLQNPGAGSVLEIEAAIVDSETTEEALDSFAEQLENEGYPEEAAEELLSQAREISLPDRFQDMLASEALNEMVTVTTYNSQQNLQSGYDGVWTFPEDFRTASWSHMLLGESVENVPDLELQVRGDSGMRAGVMEDITASFIDQVNIRKETAAAPEEAAAEEEAAFLEPREIEGRTMITSFDYYTAGIAVMFVLYTAVFIASSAFTEKETHVFDRVLTANVPTFLYVLSKGTAGMLLAFIQMGLIFLFARLAFGVVFPDIFLTVLIMTAMSAAVGGFSTILTTLNYRLNNTHLTNLFSSAAVTLMAFAGGSFFNVSQLSDTFTAFGRLLPNGAAMQSLLAVMGGGSGELIRNNLLIILLFTGGLLAAAALLFPKRGAR